MERSETLHELMASLSTVVAVATNHNGLPRSPAKAALWRGLRSRVNNNLIVVDTNVAVAVRDEVEW